MLRNKKRVNRKKRIRARISGSKKVPRLCVFRSLKILYAQLIDDEKNVTLVSVDSREIKNSKFDIKMAEEMGKMLAEKADKKGIKRAIFDRGGYKFHGKVKAVAEGARKAGLKI
jgi:large subunit ribosomal protein L18